MNVLEIGRDARAALASAATCNVVMTFSRGEVVETDRGEIVWFDCDPEAFSPRGVLVDGIDRSPSAPRADVAYFADFDAQVARFLAALDTRSIAAVAPILLGLGPGLTPAGDDYLGGFLCTLHHLGRPAAIDTTATHAISRARLGMHLRGEGTRAEVRFVRALIAGESTDAAEAVLTRHGHSSGNDFTRGARAAWLRRSTHPASQRRAQRGLQR